MVRAIYEKEAATVKPVERFRARHILVATEQEAKDIEARLKKGEKFAALAKAKSLDGSKDFGGDLGYFTADEMVAEFATAIRKMKKGQTTGPVKTEFGWHIITLIDRKDGGPRPYEEVRDAIRLVLLRKAVQDTVDGLRKKAKIEMIDPGLKEMLKLARKQRDAIEARRKAAQAGKSKAKKAEPASN
jgi:peptidyl-prolyl cis-trans isomerase C